MQDRITGESITLDGIRRGLVAMVESRVLPKAGRRSLRQHRDASPAPSPRWPPEPPSSGMRRRARNATSHSRPHPMRWRG
jgi:hypothetical protein